MAPLCDNRRHQPMQRGNEPGSRTQRMSGSECSGKKGTPFPSALEAHVQGRCRRSQKEAGHHNLQANRITPVEVPNTILSSNKTLCWTSRHTMYWHFLPPRFLCRNTKLLTYKGQDEVTLTPFLIGTILLGQCPGTWCMNTKEFVACEET